MPGRVGPSGEEGRPRYIPGHLAGRTFSAGLAAAALQGFEELAVVDGFVDDGFGGGF